MNPTFVIVSRDTGKFLSRRGWTAEYPDARKFDKPTQAVTWCQTLNGRGEYAKVVKNYGEIDEAVIYPRELIDGRFDNYADSRGDYPA